MTHHQAERNQIMSCMYKLDDFKSDFRFIHEEIDDRLKESADNLESLPELMCEIFSTCENTLATQKNSFISELDEVISKQLFIRHSCRTI